MNRLPKTIKLRIGRSERTLRKYRASMARTGLAASFPKCRRDFNAEERQAWQELRDLLEPAKFITAFDRHPVELLPRLIVRYGRQTADLADADEAAAKIITPMRRKTFKLIVMLARRLALKVDGFHPRRRPSQRKPRIYRPERCA